MSCITSASVMPSMAKLTICHKATAASAKTTTPSWKAIRPLPGRRRPHDGHRLVGPARAKREPPQAPRTGAVSRSIKRDRRSTSNTHDSRRQRAGLLLEAEAVGPGHQRPEQHLIVDQDHDQHGADGPAHRDQIAVLDGERDIGADAGQRDRRIADADRFRGDDEEPAPRHRHHHVPDELRHGERHVEPPELIQAQSRNCATPLRARSGSCAATGRS